jgi:hypothetical protein
MILFLLSCKTVGQTQDTSALEAVPVFMESTREIRRISIDLRGKLPTLDEYQRAAQGEIPKLITTYINDDAFQETMIYHLNEVWHTRVDEFDIVTDDFNLDSAIWWYPFNRSIGEEPLRLMSYIISNDLPWTDIVTADYTIANELLYDIFPLEYPESESGWQPSYYNDGRPPVGVLATNGLWWRYPTNSFNMNRTRAATITRLLLCDDYLMRPVSFEASSDVLEDTNKALKSDPACLTCHSSLDPLAASMFGFWWLERYNPLEATYYHPERELMGEVMMEVSPAWFGSPVQNFAEIGMHIANDPRFHQCTVRTFREILLRRPLQAEDYPQTVEIQKVYQNAENRIKPMLTAIVQSDEYRLAEPNSTYPNARTPKMLAPHQVVSAIETLTNYSWKINEIPLMDYDYRAMAGGVDGYQTFSAQLYPSLTSSLTIKRYTQAAVSYAVEEQLNSDSGLLSLVTNETNPDEPEFSKQLSNLRLQLHGKETDELWLQQTTELWSAAYEIGGSQLAWTAVLCALFQDLDFVSY